MSGLDVDIVVRRNDGFELQVAFAVGEGSTAAVLGPNGAGKSTLVSALAGLLPIDSGKVVLNGQALDHPDSGRYVDPGERSIGVVFQEYLLFPHMSSVDNVAFGLRSHGVSRDEARTRAMDWLQRLEIGDVGDRRPSSLSGGQAQRVALARALITGPDLLLLDEPLSSLDVTTRAEIRHLLADHLSLFAGPRLLITHDPTEAFLLADQVHIIEGGRLTQSGSPDDIRIRPRTDYAADLAGTNLLRGLAGRGTVDVDGHSINIADRDLAGPVLLLIQPSSIAVHSAAPGGSPRNSWRTRIERLERLGSRFRLRTGDPAPLTVEVTDRAVEELGLGEQVEVWISVKATEIGVEPDT